MMKKICSIAAMLLLAGILISCNTKEPPVTTALPDVQIYADGATEYKIIRGQKSSAEVKSIMNDLYRAFKTKFGIAPTLSDDWVKDPAVLEEEACEILLGDTNRPESIELKKSLPKGDSYAIAVKGKRIVIVASGDAVLGEAVNVFIKEYLQKNAVEGSLTLKGDLLCTQSLASFVRAGWKLDCPSPKTGILMRGVYYSGSGLADDTRKETDECSRMHLLTDVTEQDFNAYVELLKAAEYTQELDNTIGENRYAGLTKDGKNCFVSYVAATKEMRVSEDRAGVSISEFAYTAKGDLQTQIYQYGLYYDPNNEVTSTTVNCGMMYIVRLSDNSLVIVDSGHYNQGTMEMLEGLMSFLHEITGTQKGEKIKVAAWYMTHAHGDHVTVMAKLCKRYHKELDLQRVMYNIPSYQVRSNGYDGNTTKVKAIISAYYPTVKFLKLHSGQTFHLADLGVEVLYTHEDAVGKKQFEEGLKSQRGVSLDLNDYNSSSAVVRFTIDGKSVLLLGDISGEAEKVIGKNFDASVMKSDVVQAAHHCFNYLNTLYPMIAAPMVLMPNSEFACHTADNLPKLESILKYVERDQIYYEGSGTYGFVVEDGQFKLIYEAPVIGGPHDGTGI